MGSRTGRLGLPRFLGRGVAVGVLACVVCVAVAAPARAERGSEALPDGEQPGIARVSLIEGQASYMRGDADDWTGVSVNAPLVTGDRFFSGADSRAEIQLAPAVYARLSSETELGMLELGPDTTQVRLPVGLVTLRVRRPPGDRHVEIDTPGAAVVVREPGIYRVHVERDGDTNLQVRDGEATVYVADERYEIGDGRGVVVEGTGDAARPRIYAVSGGDGWDQWEAERARRIEGASSYAYVSDEVYGVEDLDEHGDWEYRSEYGNVWRPRHVDAGWAPYTSGRWVWVDPWGWTWLGYEPWGWAPYHYGRWVYLDSYWAWAPGPIVARPVYAPALVGWFGAGFGWGGVSVSVGFGPSVGWVPLGWGEPCFPWWGGWGGVVVGSPWWGGWGGPRIYNNVVINKNITNINVNNYNFGNLRKPGGFSTVPVRDFLRGRGGRSMPPGAGGRDFTPIGGRVPVVPTRDSLPATDPSRVGVGRNVQPARDVARRPVVSARTPAGGQPSFERKLPMVERGSGAPLTPTTLRQLGADAGRTPPVRTIAPAGGGPTGSRPLPDRGGGRTLPAVQTSGLDRDPGRLTARYGGSGDGAPSARRAPTGAADPSGGRSARSVPRPPSIERGSYPAAPRAGGSREPYVARRPTWDGGSGSTVARGGPVVERSGSSAPRSTWTAGDRSPRTLGSSGGRTPPSGGSTPQRSGRTWLSQPRTVAPGGREASSPPNAYASRGPRTAPPAYRGAPGRGAAPQARSAPSGSAAPRTSSAPRSYAAPTQRSAPTVSAAPRTQSAPRTYSAPAAPRSSGGAPSFSGRSMPSGGGVSGRSAGVARSFGGSGGAPSFAGGRSSFGSSAGGRSGGFGSSGGGGGGRAAIGGAR